MAKLAKKKTMKDTISRVTGYNIKLYSAGKMTEKQFIAIGKSLVNLYAIVDK